MDSNVQILVLVMSELIVSGLVDQLPREGGMRYYLTVAGFKEECSFRASAQVKPAGFARIILAH